MFQLKGRQELPRLVLQQWISQPSEMPLPSGTVRIVLSQETVAAAIADAELCPYIWARTAVGWIPTASCLRGSSLSTSTDMTPVPLHSWNHTTTSLENTKVAEFDGKPFVRTDGRKACGQQTQKVTLLTATVCYPANIPRACRKPKDTYQQFPGEPGAEVSGEKTIKHPWAKGRICL